jgi:A/G-specific adenine glycosylase
MPGGGAPSFSKRLLEWWECHGRHDLPWQHPRTAYRVWISEIMLQQTQVSTVIPYFERWMRDFPDVETLAASTLDDVLAHWSGLGYYARARNLHRAAQVCVEEHGGALPETAEALNDLPGIGLSTANAIVSQATGRPAAVLDGNVRRVLARHAAIEGWPGKSAVHGRLWTEAESRLPDSRGADYTQAVMDLGALVCTRTRPDCGNCPIRDDCRALQGGLVDRLPSPKPAVRVSDRTVYMLILRDPRGRVLLEKRPPAGIWGGLWCLPDGKSLAGIEGRLGLRVANPTALPGFEHRLSHVRMSIRPVLADAGEAMSVQCSPSREWHEPGKAARLGLPRPVTGLLQRLKNGEFE